VAQVCVTVDGRPAHIDADKRRVQRLERRLGVCEGIGEVQALHRPELTSGGASSPILTNLGVLFGLRSRTYTF
jgi:hypothetical protein